VIRHSEFLISARALRRALRDKLVEDIEWPDGELPLSGHCYLIADGLASRSLPDPDAPQYEPWLTFLRREVEHIDFSELARGFSYYKPRFHYGRSNTDVSLEDSANWAIPLTAPYLPQGDVTATLIVFSLAGLIFTLGIAAAINDGAVKKDSIRDIILVQPAFSPTNEVVKELQEAVALPNALAGLITLREALWIRVLDALSSITASHQPIRTKMLYWEGDEFIDYTPSLRTQLEGVGVKCIPLTLDFQSGTRPFEKHSKVAQHPDFITELEKHL
jgi:hypothetical protein